MAGGSKGAVFAALAGNSFLTVVKFIAFVMSGSGAMLSEAIHSFADTANQGLLFLGIQRSERPPDKLFSYGYGGERFLFALLSAIGIFILGCGVTVYHGIDGLLHPHEVHADWVVWAVLGVSLLIDGAVLTAAIRAVAAAKGDQSFWGFVRSSSDPTVLAVLFEDFIACTGVIVAAVGIGLSELTGSSVFDSIASIVIGLLLGAVAVWLGYRNRTLILGPSIPAEVERGVLDIIRAQASVTAVSAIKSRIVGADHFKLKAEVDYDGAVLAREHVDWVANNLPDAGDREAVARFTEAFGERMTNTLATEIDRIEQQVIEKFPNLRYIDLESDKAE